MHGIRFAPSPTGHFHVGNLRTAWISHTIARALGEPWRVRFEDIDTPRVVPGARELQLSDMAELGLTPDEIVLQSNQVSRHFEFLNRAITERMAYPCTCSRKDVQAELASLASAPHSSPSEYTGHCRNQAPSAPESLQTPIAWRFRRDDPSGRLDPIIARAPWGAPTLERFVPSYTWACAIDDIVDEHRILVRAHDLSHAIDGQRAIQKWVSPDANLPAVFHTSLVTQNDGSRLEKRTQGVTLCELKASGLTPQTLIARFRDSFDLTLTQQKFEATQIMGETSQALTLRALGIS